MLKLLTLKVKYLFLLASLLLQLYPTMVIEQKNDFHAKVKDIKGRYFTTSDFSKSQCKDKK